VDSGRARLMGRGLKKRRCEFFSSCPTCKENHEATFWMHRPLVASPTPKFGEARASHVVARLPDPRSVSPGEESGKVQLTGDGINQAVRVVNDRD
jgi:hypothetical protein